MPFCQQILADHRVQVDIHELEDQINILVVFSPNDFVQLYDVWMLQLLKEHDFAIGSLGVG